MSQDSSSPDIGQIQKIMVPIVFIIFIGLAIEYAIVGWLPTWMTIVRRFLIIFLIFAPSRGSYRITGIPDFTISLFAIFYVFVQLPPISAAGSMIRMPPSTYNDSLINILMSIVVISLLIPMTWYTYRLLESRIFQLILLGSSTVTYILSLIAQYSEDWGPFFYVFSILFTTGWLIFATLQAKLLYPSSRTRWNKILLLSWFLSLFAPVLLLSIYPSEISLTLAHLGVDLWLFFTWYTIFTSSDALILSRQQTLFATRAYYEIKSQEVDECVVYYNVDRYFRNIPEEVIREVDDDQLTLMWIGLQGTNKQATGN